MELNFVVTKNSLRVFDLQEKGIKIMTGARPRTSSKPIFKTLEILTAASQYVSYEYYRQ